MQPYLVHASQPAVSPDGRRVAFVRRGEVWVLSRDGGAPHAITKPVHGWGDAGEPRWSPDGSTVVFVRSDGGLDGYGAVFSVPAVGGAAHQLTKRDCVDAPTTNGETVLYAAFLGDCVHGDDPRIRAVTRTAQVHIRRFPFRRGRTIRSGRRMAGASRSRTASARPTIRGFHDVLLVATGAGRPRRLVSAYGLFGAAWSPSGRMLAFERYADDGDIWTIGADGTQPRRLTHGPADDSAPAWLP